MLLLFLILTRHTARWSTLISIAFTVLGAFALSSESSIIKWTYWSSMGVTNITSGETWEVYMGLRAMVMLEEPCDVFGCKEEIFWYANNGEYPNDFVKEQLGVCRDFALSESFNILLTCVTLGFALIGTANRMRFKSDYNIQKALGMTTDLVGCNTHVRHLGVFAPLACNYTSSTDIFA